ncbi:MAG: nitronate monooxygenase [Dehalococcoidia bacterium]|nr:nitronate monooxygenase [Dehalococcoidia bacterium]
MAGAQGADLTIAVCEAGGLGSLPCAMLRHEQVRSEVARIREQTEAPFSLNFFCHAGAEPDPDSEERWRRRLAPYFVELGVEASSTDAAPSRSGFDEAACALVEDLRPPVVSFHFGLPEAGLLARVRATGARVLSSATSVEEGLWLEERGVDAVIAQGAEAGGHQATFLRADVTDVSEQVGTFALVPLIASAVRVPVVAAGGIGEGRAIAAAFALGASGVQVGSAYLFTEEATIAPAHRAALEAAAAAGSARTALTNVFSGRPARSMVNRIVEEVGPISADAPAFPSAGRALAPLRSAPEGAAQFASLWAGQAAPLGRSLPASDLTRLLWDEAVAVAGQFAG